MRYELAIFDMDGTILNTLEDIQNAINYALKKNGLPELNIDQVRSYVGNGTRRLVELAVPAGTGEDEKDRVYNDYLPYYEAHAAEKTQAYPGVTELLKTLREAGVKTAVVSNKPDAAVKKLAEKYFPGLFDMAVGEDEPAGIKRKPAPDEVEFVLNAMHFYKMQAVYIGDSDVDMETAKNSGLDLISVSWGFRTREYLQVKGAQTIVSSAYEIEKLILTDLSSVKKVVCPNCGAEFEDNRDRCPFCNTIYEEGAERAYMHKLGEIRDNMDNLSEKIVKETEAEVKKISKKAFRIIVGIVLAVLIIALLFSVSEIFYNVYDKYETRKTEKWEEENLAQWNHMYFDKEYEELYILYKEGDENGDPVWDFNGAHMMVAMDDLRSFEEYYEEYMDPDYENSKSLVELMLYGYYETTIGADLGYLTDYEKRYLADEIDQVRQEGDQVFGLSEKELKSLTLDGYDDIASWDKIEDMVKENWDDWKD